MSNPHFLDEAPPLNMLDEGGDPKLLRLGRVINTLGRLSPKLAGWIALQLFMRPRRSKYSPAAEVFMSKAAELQAASRGRLHGYQWGAKTLRPRVLLVHGWESHAGRWIPMAEALLRSGAQVTAFDGPAQGRSSGRRTPFNEYVTAALDFEAAHGPFDAYVGHSLGGGVVIQLAARVPVARQPKAVVCMAGFDESEHVFERYHRMLGYQSHVQASYDRHVLKLLGPSAAVRDYSNTAAVAQLGDIKGLVVHSDDDEVMPIAEGLILHGAWPNAELHQYPDGQHRLTAEHIVERIVEWVVENGK